MNKRSNAVKVLAVMLSSFLAVSSSSFAAVITIASNSDVIAGRNAFLGAGTTTTQFDWSSLFSAGAHTPGVLIPNFSTASVSVTLPDSTVNSVVGANASAAALNFGNWVDAPGFNGSGGSAAADLAINGVESFDLSFGKDHRSVGLAIITGAGNLSSEIDLTDSQNDEKRGRMPASPGRSYSPER